MNYWKVIFATVVIFGAGVVTGGLLVDHVREAHAHISKPPHPPVVAVNATTNATPATNVPPQHLPDFVNRQFLPKLDTQLSLSSDQHKAIEKIITDCQAEMRKVSQDARLAIRAELTPDQRSRFDDLMKPHPNKRTVTNTNVVDLLSTNPIVGTSTNTPTVSTNH